MAFVASTRIEAPKGPHRDTLPPPPKSWKSMLKHPHFTGFRAATDKEYRVLLNKGTFEYTEITRLPKDQQLLPLMWVFTYKYNSNGYLTKYKARLVVCGDLQSTEEETYTAILAA